MKKYIYLFILHIIALSTLKAQSIKGLVNDEEGWKEGATVALLNTSDSSVVKITITGRSGAFNFSDINIGWYFITVSHIGYGKYMSPAFMVTADRTVNVNAYLKPLSPELQAVEVKSQKPLVEINGNKITLNIEGTANSIGSDMLELMRKSPGIAVDRDGNIRFNGKNGITIFIDGKKVDLSGQDLVVFLQSIPSSQVQSVEFIPDPSVRYDAEGNAGVINIRLKKDRALGINGSVNSNLSFGIYAKYNSGFSLNYRNKKINIFGNYSFNHSLSRTQSVSERTVIDSFFYQKGYMNQSSNTHSLKAGLDYYITKKHVVGILFHANFSDPEWDYKSNTSIYNANTHARNRVLETASDRKQIRTNALFNASYNYTDLRNLLSVNIDHNFYHSDNCQYQPNVYFDTTGKTQLYSTIYRMVAPASIDINTANADWVKTFKMAKLESGIKTSFVHSENDSKYYDVYSLYEELSDHNRFNYYENIYAAYSNYTHTFSHMTLELGFRTELTSLQGTSTNIKGATGEELDSVFKRHYLDIFPRIAVNYVLGKTLTLGLNFNRRIDRPNYQELNPFEFRLDDYTMQKGNINLRPQYTQSMGINLAFKEKLKFSLTYSNVKDMFVLLTDTTFQSKSVLAYENMDKERAAAFMVSYPYQYKGLSLFASLSGTYSRLRADFGTGRLIDQQVKALNASLQAAMRISKVFSFDMTTYYNSSDLYQGTFITKPVWTMDAGLSQVFAHGKLSLKESVTDIFHTLNYRDESNFAGQRTIIYTHFESRQFKIGLFWRFGSSQVQSAREHSISSEEENKRAN